MEYRGDCVSAAPSSVPVPVATPPPRPAAPALAAPKILSRNANGTVVPTSTPNNEAELQLYRVMQRASLLAYYDTLLEMGGDDVQQLCEAGEEEFLEIMALVGMAAKPLHVRRLQKALQEWLTNPAMFQAPLVPSGFSPHLVVPPSSTTPTLAPPSPSQSSPSPATPGLKQEAPPGPASTPTLPHQSPSPNPAQGLVSEVGSSAGSPGRAPASSTSPAPCPSPGSPLQLTPVLVPSQISRLADAARNLVRSLPTAHLEPKPSATKKKACKDLESILAMSEDDPQRIEQIRKFAAIYGRFDCKRKPEKPLTLHEVSVNEAAAQICRLVPALLTRRDELFPLARQVVRDSGYHYSKGHSKSYSVGHGSRSILAYSNGEQASKRPRLESLDLSDDVLRRQERLEQIAEELRSVGERTEELLAARELNSADLPVFHYQLEAMQARHSQLILEQTDLLKHQPSQKYYQRTNSCGRVSSSFDLERIDTDDTDSQLSFSNASSPYQEVGDSRDSLTREAEAVDPLSPNVPPQEKSDDSRSVDGMILNHSKPDPEDLEDPYFQENKVQVIASSGGNIIAVANPALSMSPAIADTVLLKKEALSPKLSLS